MFKERVPLQRTGSLPLEGGGLGWGAKVSITSSVIYPLSFIDRLLNSRPCHTRRPKAAHPFT